MSSTPNIPEYSHLYVVEDKAYDLKQWIPRHPGGTLWFAHSKGEDISGILALHNDPRMIMNILKKYEVPVDI